MRMAASPPTKKQKSESRAAFTVVMDIDEDNQAIIRLEDCVPSKLAIRFDLKEHDLFLCPQKEPPAWGNEIIRWNGSLWSKPLPNWGRYLVMGDCPDADDLFSRTSTPIRGEPSPEWKVVTRKEHNAIARHLESTQEVIDYIKGRGYPNGCTKDEKESVARKGNYVMAGRYTWEQKERRLVHKASGRIEFHSKTEILEQFFKYHCDDDHGQHTGLASTWKKIRRHFHAKDLYKVFGSMIRRCPICSLRVASSQ
ncbi:hypothetical protein HDU86_002494 [Geranomyces michiganensis]|nr:hypothetical protein HDU86_002494 [Geranomyces michiganensis]